MTLTVTWRTLKTSSLNSRSHAVWGALGNCKYRWLDSGGILTSGGRDIQHAAIMKYGRWKTYVANPLGYAPTH